MAIIKGDYYNELFDTEDIVQEALATRQKIPLNAQEWQHLQDEIRRRHGSPAKPKANRAPRGRPNKPKPVTLPRFKCLEGVS